jgi:hypothetical protein
MNPAQQRVFAGTQLWAGANSIGGIATEKVQSDALNLGFPSAYQSVYAARKLPLRYYPTVQSVPSLYVGNDLQSQIHESRRRDADYMARAKVISTQHSRVRFCGTPHGMGDRPHPRLAQRVFANPSNGAFEPASGRQDHPDAPFSYRGGGDYVSNHLTGGVLRSAQGQKFGKQVLVDRIRQLDDIQKASSEFVSGTMSDNGLPLGTDSMVMSNFPQAGGIELNLLLQSIIDSTMGGDMGGEHLNRLDMSNCYKAITLIFRTVPRLQNDEITDILAKVDIILTNLQGLLDPDENTTLTTQTREIALSLDVLFTKLKTYLEKMMENNGEIRQTNFFNPLTNTNEVRNVLVPTDRGTTLSPPERANLSSNLIASLGFSKLLRWNPAQYNELLSTADRERLMSNQQRQSYRSGDFGVDGDGDDLDDEDGFDSPGRPREDTQHDEDTGRSRQERDFDADERETFAMNSGFYYDQEGNVRGQNTYFGEEAPSMEEGYEAVASEERQPLLPPQTDERVRAVRAKYRAAKNEEATRFKRELLGSQASSTIASESTFQPPSIGSLFSRYDPDTQGFNVGYAFQDSTTPRSSVVSVPPSVRSARSAPSVRSTPSARSARSAPVARRPAETARAVARPTSIKGDDQLGRIRIVYRDEVPEPAPKKGKKAKAPAPVFQPIALPKTMSEVPTDIDTLLRIANSAGIRVNRKADGTYGKANNIRRNIILRLGLAGKR